MRRIPAIRARTAARDILARCTALALILSAAASAVRAERPEGLLWNRSGLPATLPLQVKTAPGADFLLRLHETGAEHAILAAYIRGGEFFRVLVPAGEFDLHFATGPAWQDESTLFGDETRQFMLAPPLAFRATASRRNGHLVDLRDLDDITVQDFAICQHLAFEAHQTTDGLGSERPEPFPQRPRDQMVEPPSVTTYPWRFDTRSRVCD